VTAQNNPYANPFPLMISVVVLDAAQLTAVYGLLGGVSHAALGSGNVQRSPTPPGGAQQDTGRSSAGDETLAQEDPASAGTGPDATTDASPSEIDAHGHPWSAELHASTKGKTKDGLWRMKVGMVRPAPLPGFPVDNSASTAATGTSQETPPNSATSQAATDQGAGQPATSGAEGEDDEFAAFRAAAAASDATDAAAAASVPARTYSDADLGALCNQAAVKLGDPTPIKEIIATYTPEGQVAHSRNIPEDKRAEFVAAVEAKAGIEFAG
jgi:hypothetical protein